MTHGILILILETVSILVCTPLVVIYFSLSAQATFSDLVLCHDSGGGGESSVGGRPCSSK
jgi:hypothetical protein